MKKKIFSIALVAMAMVMFSCNNSTSNEATTESKEEKCAEKSNCDKKHQCVDPFEGIELTPEQQEALKALKDTKCDADKQCAESKQCAEGKECAEGRQCASKGKEAKAECLVKVKEILTPEQYTQFLENMVINAPAHGPKGAGHHECKHGDKQKHGDCKGEQCKDGGNCPHEAAGK